MTVGAVTKMNKMKDKLYLSISKYCISNVLTISNAHAQNHHFIAIIIRYSMQKKYLVQLMTLYTAIFMSQSSKNN